MSEPFIGQIIMGGWNFAPRGYATCDGQLLSISQNTALFSLLGTTFGGNGQTTFGLPDLRGRAPLHFGQGPGRSNRSLGEASGEENHQLNTNEMPVHTHTVRASNSATQKPATGHFIAGGEDASIFGTSPDTTLNLQANANAGGSQPHNNMQPFLVVTFCIALEGIFPSRN